MAAGEMRDNTRPLHRPSTTALFIALVCAPLAACDSEEIETTDMLELSDGEFGGDEFRAANYYIPVGTHDVANCDTIAGWVKDGDTTAPTWVTIHRDAAWPNGQEVAVVQANLYRADLDFADKNHGFSIPTPASLKTGLPVRLYIHGINVDANGDWDVNALSPLLSQTGKEICCGDLCDFDSGGDFVDIPQQ
ncbi:hypothetical protein G6O69_36655 [Pseudenhygromyxa sp. WMMC2535]|uniref:hypothetical protein n=1 Tax=Pseudenhygromyxa sp. WMMC2535 TaxID=2712867 RepID=UPI0015542E4F|nr:hypothetical protein [Pseudenhygromyxa sp. WMMC2535]NVB36215.1 hypothetical protein [Pseudenhygromyxa sp. WMMC2535]NVB43414.1 hypothetical protein [Pseudenhygromyxa sp. WMMC2535]